MKVKKYNKANFPQFTKIPGGVGNMWRSKDGYVYVQEGNKFMHIYPADVDNEMIILLSPEENIKLLLEKIEM